MFLKKKKNKYSNMRSKKALSLLSCPIQKEKIKIKNLFLVFFFFLLHLTMFVLITKINLTPCFL